MTNKSRAFGTAAPASPHLIKGSGGLAGEIFDLRGDVEAAILAVEAQVQAPTVGQANIRLNTQPTAGDTLTMGADIYEFKAALTDAPTTPGNILVLRGGSAAAARTNINDAINGAGVAAATSSAQPTIPLKASTYNTDYLHIEPADVPGGTPQTGTPPSVALSDGLTAAVNWDRTNLNKSGFSGNMKKTIVKIVVDATNLANNFDEIIPFVPRGAQVLLVTDTNGDTDLTGKSAVITLVPSRSAITIDLDGGATDPIATDIVYIEVWGFSA